ANRATGLRTVTRSNGEGYYVTPPLPPGVYDVSISAPGFAAAKIEAVALEVGQSRTLNTQLNIGQLQDAVTVTDSTPLLTTNRADRGTVIENKFVTSIPLNLRNPLLLLTLAPGVTGGLNAGINTASQSTTNNFRINGGRGATNEILIDGAANTGTYNNQVSAIPQVDSLQEFKVNTSPYAAEFGRTGGGVISFAIRSGSNDFHGSLQEFLRNSVLDANGFNSNRAGQAKPSFKRNQFGFTVGGPVWVPKLYRGRNRTFFFAAYEGLRERSLASFTGTVPTALERTGDFSRSLDAGGKLNQIYDPRTTRLDPNRPAGTTRYLRDPFSGNVIPPGQIASLGPNVFKYFPLPNQPGQGFSNVGNYYVAAANSIDANRVDLRVDHQISSRHQVFGRYNWFSNLNAQPLVFGNAASPVQTPNRIPGINWMGNHTWTINAGTILDHHFSLAQSETNRIPLSLGFDQTTLGLPKSVTEGQRVAYFPQVGVGGITGLGPQGTASNVVVSKTLQYAASVTLLRGRHTMKAGVDWRRFPVRIDNSPALSISAGGGFTGGPNPQAVSASTGAGLADLLLGLASVSYQVRPVEQHVHAYYAGFFQDEFKLAKSLSLTVGLRYNLETPRTEANNEYVFLDLDTPSPLRQQAPSFPDLRGSVGFVGVNGAGRRTQLVDTNNFDPRLGLAWQVNAATVVRSGFGIFHHPLVPNTDLAQGFNRTTTSLITAADGVSPIFSLGNPFPEGLLQPTGNTLGLNTLLGQSISGPLRQQRLPYQAQWSLDVQRQLPWSFVVDAGYAGNSAVALPAGVNYNQLPDALLTQGTALVATVPNPFFGIITDPTSSLSRATVQRGQLLRPYPQFTGMSASQAPVGHSSYHALQLKVERRFSQGFALLFAYTHSKTIDNTAELGGFLGPSPGFQDNYCFSCDRSLSYQHIPDVARISYRYELPFGIGKPMLKQGVLARVVGGWALAGFISADNGTPVSVTSPNDSNSFGGGSGMRPNATGQKAKLDDRQYVDGASYFNAAAFARTPQFTFGNVSRTLPDVRNPGNVNWDVLIEKRMAITERVGLDFRTELYNALNQVIFGGPVTSVTSADFGKIRLNQVNTPRQIQFGLRLSF
ncbi:MAG TPA: carboxypeptidase-like regulatory domain-containing protein, partial [Bryobacteraceae bacterium]|nr:carboxypeptidase-like regulatory domain-containing protein [Bryobacteraceae bacterium]